MDTVLRRPINMTKWSNLCSRNHSLSTSRNVAPRAHLCSSLLTEYTIVTTDHRQDMPIIGRRQAMAVLRYDRPAILCMCSHEFMCTSMLCIRVLVAMYMVRTNHVYLPCLD